MSNEDFYDWLDKHYTTWGQTGWTMGARSDNWLLSDLHAAWQAGFAEAKCTSAIDLLKEAREAIFNMKPSARARGCFVDGQADCVCTACKLKRAIAELEDL